MYHTSYCLCHEFSQQWNSFHLCPTKKSLRNYCRSKFKLRQQRRSHLLPPIFSRTFASPTSTSNAKHFLPQMPPEMIVAIFGDHMGSQLGYNAVAIIGLGSSFGAPMRPAEHVPSRFAPAATVRGRSKERFVANTDGS